MPSIVFGAATFPTRLCVILTSASTGSPISGVPFFCHAVVTARSAAAPAAQSSVAPLLDVPLGTLASDQAGYLSFDLSELERRLEDLQQQQTITGSNATIEVDKLWLHPYSPIAQSIDALAVENVIDDALVIRLVVDPDSVYASNGNGFASMQAPGLTDWYLSPGSFGHLSAEIVGQDGCETLLPSNIAVQSFQFIQILPVSQQFALSEASSGNRYVKGNRNAIVGQLRSTGEVAMKVATQISSTSLELQSGIPAGTSSAGLGLYVMYDASWLPVGHGLGQIVYSMPLAPAEQVNIAIIDWSRTSTDSRVENTGLTDTLQHDTTRDRTVGEVVDSTVKEWQRGGSIMGGASVTGGYGGMIGAAASLGGAYQTSSGDRSVSANTVQNLSDRFAQTSTSIRDLRSTVIVQSSQQETQNLQTRTVRNYNHSHAMTVLYYEVLRHYRTVVERGDVGPALLIAQSMPDFDEGAVFNYRRFLEPALLMSELAPGFDAGETLYALEQDPPPPPPVDPTTIAFNLFRIIFHCGASTSQASVSAEIRPSNYEDPPASLLGPDGSTGNLGLALRFVDAANNSVEVQAVPQGGSVTWNDIGFFAITVQLIPDSTHDNETLRLDVGFIEVKGIDGNGVEHAMGNWTGNQTYAGPGSEIFPIITAVRPAPPPAPLSPLQQLPIDQRHLYVRLIAHLNSNKSYYYKQIWMAEEPNTRAMRFKDVAVTIGGSTLPLLSVVENRVLDVCGAELVMPMDPSYFVSNAISNSDRQLLTLPVVAHARTEQLISLPTRGVFAEAKLGHCNASEVIDNTRFWDWQTSPIPDLAPPITGIAPVTPQAAPNLVPTAFPASVLSIQQPAPAPDPIGLRAALDVLKTPGIFNNMSGIQQLQGLLTTLTNAAVQAQGISKQSPASGQAASGSGTGSTTPTSSAPTPPSSSTAASTPSSPTTDTGGAVTPATVSPEPAAPSSVSTNSNPAPTPSPAKPTGLVKAVGSKTAIFYFNFTDPISMVVPGYLMITGMEETSDNSAQPVTIWLDHNTQGPWLVSGSMPMQVSTDKVSINIQADVLKSDGTTVHKTGSLTATAPPAGSVWSFDVNVVLDASRPVTITTHSETTIPAKTSISEQLGIDVADIGKLTFENTKTDPSVDKTDSTQTTTYGLQEYTNVFNIVQR